MSPDESPQGKANYWGVRARWQEQQQTGAIELDKYAHRLLPLMSMRTNLEI